MHCGPNPVSLAMGVRRTLGTLTWAPPRAFLACLLTGVAIFSCTHDNSAPSTASARSSLDTLRAAIADQSAPLPPPFTCAGFDHARELQLNGQTLVVLACNRNGLLATFRHDESLVATREIGKPIVVSLFASDESAQALDKLLVEEYSSGTGVRERSQVVYHLTDKGIAELWRGDVFLRAAVSGAPDGHLDGYVLHQRGEYHGHGPLLIHGVRTSSRGRYKEQVFEITRDAVQPYKGERE